MTLVVYFFGTQCSFRDTASVPYPAVFKMCKVSGEGGSG